MENIGNFHPYGRIIETELHGWSEQRVIIALPDVRYGSLCADDTLHADL